MLEGKHHQIHGLIKIHQEAGHVGVSDGNWLAGLNLVNKQRDNAAPAAHDVAVASAAYDGAVPRLMYAFKFKSQLMRC